jgi:dihydroorotate dehydrogenase
LLKIAPDLTEEQVGDIAEIVVATDIDGVIATNTTLARQGLSSPAHLVAETGGLSGAPLRKKSTEVIRLLRSRLGASKVIIGVGGIFNASDAREKLAAGADLVQVYTGFIYEGPGIVRNILKGL